MPFSLLLVCLVSWIFEMARFVNLNVSKIYKLKIVCIAYRKITS